MQLFPTPGDAKRMVVILQEDSYDAWLQARPDHSWEFMRPFAAERLSAHGPEAGDGRR